VGPPGTQITITGHLTPSLRYDLFWHGPEEPVLIAAAVPTDDDGFLTPVTFTVPLDSPPAAYRITAQREGQVEAETTFLVPPPP